MRPGYVPPGRVLYGSFLRSEAVFEKKAESNEANGVSGDAYRKHFVRQLGITSPEQQQISQIALRYYERYTALKTELQDAVKQFRAVNFPGNVYDPVYGPDGRLVLPALSQDLGGDDGMTSFTTVDYDPDSNTVTAYSETDLDYSTLPYYDVGVSLSIVDQKGSYNYTWNCTYSYENTFAPAEPTVRTITVGRTYASATAGPLPDCAVNTVTQIISDYSTYMVAFHPACSDFITSEQWNSVFSWGSMVQSETAAYQDYAILQSYMNANLTTLQAKYGPITINSGYRDPQAEKRQVKYYPNSRHMAGDAVDLATGNSSNTWGKFQTAGHANHACVEPATLQGKNGVPSYDHSHLDWRTFGSGTYKGPAKCPPGW